MPSVNKVFLVGHLGRDAELRVGKSGTSFSAFSVATNTGRGETRKTEWTNCVAFGQNAEYLVANSHKGSLVMVEGSLSTRTYTDKAGAERKATEVMVDHVSVLDKASTPTEVDELKF